MRPAPRVVFDCNVYFQALIGRRGPAEACLECAARRDVLLFCSEHTIAELHDVATRPKLKLKFGITEERLLAITELVRGSATFVDIVPERFTLGTDPDDSHYVNLALEADARLVVSRDRDLLRLADSRTAEATDFRRRFPKLRIIDPPEMLRLIADSAGTESAGS